MTDTKSRILDTARRMVQARGYNALSFREIGKIVGIKSAAVHHHYPTKGDLGAALASQYADAAKEYLSQMLESCKDQREIVDAYTTMFRAALLDENRMCLCGIMSAEQEDLPAQVRVEIERFNVVNIEWLTELLALHKPESDRADLENHALAIFAAIEGAQLVARGRGDIRAYDDAIKAYRATGLLP